MKVEIIEERRADHIHLLVSIPPYMGIAQFIGERSKSKKRVDDFSTGTRI